MKTKAIIIWAGVVMSSAAFAHGDRVSHDYMDNTQIAEVVYDSPAFNRGIHSYPIIVPQVPIAKINGFYVDRANGPAIYSYPKSH